MLETEFNSANGDDDIDPAEYYDAAEKAHGTVKRIRSAWSTSEVQRLGNHWWGLGDDQTARLVKEIPGAKLGTALVGVHCLPSPPDLGDVHQFWVHARAQRFAAESKYFALAVCFGPMVLLGVHQVVDDQEFERALSGDCLRERLKFVVSPVNMPGAWALKGPRRADTVDAFFGSRNVKLTRETVGRVGYTTVAIDLKSVRAIRIAYQLQGLPSLGRIVDFSLVSCEPPGILSTFRIGITDELRSLMTELLSN